MYGKFITLNIKTNFKMFEVGMYDYTDFTEHADMHGYTYEPFTVRTTDAWHLSIFRITGYKD